MNDWLGQQINTARSLIPVLGNQLLDEKLKINTPLETAQKATISELQQEINQQKQELEAQSQANIGLAKINTEQQELLGQHLELNAGLTLAKKEEKAKGLLLTTLGSVGTFLLTNSFAPVAPFAPLDFVNNPPPAEVQNTAQKETLTDLPKNVSGLYENKYPGYKKLPQLHRQYLESHILFQGGSVTDVDGFPNSLESVRDTAVKQGSSSQAQFSVPNEETIHKILTFAFGNTKNLDATVPPYTMTQDELTKTLNSNN